MANQVKIAETTVLLPKGLMMMIWRGEGLQRGWERGSKLMPLIRLREMKTNFPHHLCFSLSMHNRKGGGQ